jgi:hypothetical protein
VRRRDLSIACALAAAAIASACGSAPAPLAAPGEVRSLAVAPDYAGTVWLVTSTGAVRSTTGGHRWDRISGGRGVRAVAFADEYTVTAGRRGIRLGSFGGARLFAPRRGPASFVALASPYHNTDRVYALDSAGGLWVSVRRAKGWQRLRAAGLPPGVVALAARRGSPALPDVIYAAAGGGGLWRSADFGASFHRVAAVRQAFSVATTTADPLRVLVATPRLMLSADDGQTFEPVGPAVEAVAFDPRNWRVAFAAAGGRLLRSADGGVTWGRG